MVIDWLIFIPACFALNLAFGPNNLLAMTHSARGGIPFAQRASIGRLLVFVPMIAASALGLGLLLMTSAVLFNIVKIIGAFYLIWLGIKLWRSAQAVDFVKTSEAETSPRDAFRAEALVAISNPKAVLIFAAFFPQFVVTEAYWESYLLLGVSFLVLESVAIFAYACAGRFASRFAKKKMAWMQRGSGAMMCLFGALLLLSPQPARS